MLCHKEVKRIAKELAGAAYENFAKEDKFYKAYPYQIAFIKRHWQNFVPIARSTLLYMLSKPEYTEAMKADIFEIYVKDYELQQVKSVPASQAAGLTYAPSQGNA
jgi:hypothetical protein